MRLDIATLQAALIGYRGELERIDRKMAEIRKQLGLKHGADQPLPLGNGDPWPRKKRVLSAAARKRIAAAQKKRWTAHRAAKKAE